MNYISNNKKKEEKNRYKIFKKVFINLRKIIKLK